MVKRLTTVGGSWRITPQVIYGFSTSLSKSLEVNKIHLNFISNLKSKQRMERGMGWGCSGSGVRRDRRDGQKALRMNGNL